MRTIAIINQKGGCGKTTSAINLAGHFAGRGLRTLLVDMDPQSHCAAGLAIPDQRIDLDIGDAMALPGDAPLDWDRLLWRVSRRLDLAPSRMRLAGMEAGRGQLADMEHREHRLAMVLGRLRDRYDVCVVDCSPSIGLLAFNAIIAADAVLVPVETSFFSLRGAEKQVASIRALARRLGAEKAYWILATMFESGEAHAGDLLEALHTTFGDRVAPRAIRRDVSLKEAVAFGKPGVEYAPDSAGAKDYAAVGDWLLERLGLMSGREAEASVHVVTSPRASEQFLGERSGPTDRTGATPVDRSGMSAGDAGIVNGGNDLAATLAMAQRVRAVLAPTAPSGAPQESAPPALTEADRAEIDGREDVERAAEIVMRAEALRRRVLGLGTPVVLEEEAQGDMGPASELSASVRRILGARWSGTRAVFVYPLSMGRRVEVVGSFNAWTTGRHVLRANASLGVHELSIALGTGRHSYRLVVDGQWRIDPYNERTEPNPFGGENNVLIAGYASHEGSD